MKSLTEQIIENYIPKERHNIDYDFDNVHSCPCGGTTTGCRLCRAEMCDNPDCKLGKGKDYTDEQIKAFNQCRTEMINKIPDILSLIRGEVKKLSKQKTYFDDRPAYFVSDINRLLK